MRERERDADTCTYTGERYTHNIYTHTKTQTHTQGEIHTHRHARTEPTHQELPKWRGDTLPPFPPFRGLCTDPDEHNSAHPASIFLGNTGLQEEASY